MSENTFDNETNIDQKNTNTEANDSERVSELEAEVSKLTAILKRRKEKDADREEDVQEVQKPITNNQGDSNYERLSLKVDYGYPDNIIDSIIKNGGKTALQDPLFKRVIDEMHQEHKNEIASNIDTGSKSAWEHKYSEKDLDNMTSEELEKILPHA